MSISEGDALPDATLVRIGAEGPESVSLAAILGSGKAVIFGVPGAFTGTCTTAHVPSFIRTKDGFSEKGVEKIVCVAVNDPFVVKAWSEQTGAGDAGIEMLGDPGAEFTKAIGMNFTAPPVGFYDRSRRYAMVVEDGRVVALHAEESPGVCETSGGEALLATL
ncbi:peroxiredoxin [Palleronia aestuarii]|uniref:Glutathione-dependent peroxiredoxin n=1 Tax=Palleronia aestuarii TaxID=568105 RepID=A0A2W7NF87_9RHOB|nr:peroxiredoxin [Palleronia aestuarii]PZX18868.1 peroxiredoxin [Palleronia aestuarii]